MNGLALVLGVVLSVASVDPGLALATGSYYSRPIPLGVCGGNHRARCNGECVTGTLGSTVKNSNGTQFILSNNHVIGLSNGAASGEDITQPGCVGTSDTVAHFKKFVTLYSDQNNYVDAAVAKVVSGDVSTDDDILNIGPVSGTVGCTMYANVETQGCSTGLRSGEVVGCYASVYTSDPCLGNLSYVEQMQIDMTSPVSSGDSGSLIVGSCKAMGLLFAQNSDGTVAYANWISNVLQELNMSGMAAATGATATPEAQAQLQAAPTPSTELQLEDRKAGHVVALFSAQLMRIPGVWGVQDYGEPDGSIVIQVDVDEITPEIEERVPKTLGGFPVVIFVGHRPIEDAIGQRCPGRAQKKEPSAAPRPAK